MVAGEIAEGGRQVVGGDRRQAQPPVVPGGIGAYGTVFEPQDRGAEDSAITQRVLHDRFEDPEILADHHRSGALCFEGEDADERIVVVAHIGAARGRIGSIHHSRNRPRMVDAHARPRDAGWCAYPDTAYNRLRQALRVPRRLAPVLTLLIEAVGRRADADPLCQCIFEHPSVGTGAVDADGEVGDHPDGHAGIRRGGTGSGELLVADPLQPAVKVDAVGAFGYGAGQLLRFAEPVGPVVGAGTVVFSQGAPGGKRISPSPRVPEMR